MHYAIKEKECSVEKTLTQIQEIHQQLNDGDKRSALSKLRLLASALHTELAMRQMQTESVDIVEYIDCSRYTLPA